VQQEEQLVVEIVESAVVWVEGPVAGLCRSWASRKLGSRVVCGLSGDGLRPVVGTVVGGWLVCWFVCGCCVGCDTCGLQLLATIVLVSLLSSSSTRIWKGLLCRVSHWCTVGNCRMVFDAVMVLDILATLGRLHLPPLEVWQAPPLEM
jgi:hypothetical protein